MAQNGPEQMDVSEGYQRGEDFDKLVEAGLSEKVAEALEGIFQSGLLSYVDLDERALDAMKEFTPEGALSVLKTFRESNLDHVTNKSAYLCGVMKTWRTKMKMKGDEKSSSGKGPDETKLKDILDRTGYSLDVTTGQRKYGGPPPNWEGNPPGPGCEVFCGKVPKEIFEDELIPLFEGCGEIWDLRLMMDPLTAQNRGYAFVTFTTKDAAQKAVRDLDGHEIRPGKKLKVNVSIPNTRLFVGNIPKNKSRDEILDEFGKRTPGITDVIIYVSPDDKKKNRGFCFLDFESHKAASQAKRKLGSGRVRVWNCDIIVDWAEPQEEPDDETMSKVKVLYVRNLKTEITEETLKEAFEPFGKIDRVKKIKDYGFVHYEEREDCVKALEAMNGKDMAGVVIEVSLAKPVSDKKKQQQKQDRRVMQMMRGGFPPGRMPVGPPMMRGGRRGGMMPPGGYGGGGGGPYDDFYGDYRGGYGDPYYDDYYGYDDFDYGYGAPVGGWGMHPHPMRARGRGMMGLDRGRGRGVAAGGAGIGMLRGAVPRGVRGVVGRGNRGQLRGGRGGQQGIRGRGMPIAPQKRKADGQQQGQQTKRRGGGWSSQPIAQQPLGSQGYGYGGAGSASEQWYQDSYGGGWS